MANLFESTKQALLQLNNSVNLHYERTHDAIQRIIPSNSEVISTEDYAASIRDAMESLRTIKNNQAAMEQLLQQVVDSETSGFSDNQMAYMGRLQFSTLLSIQVRMKSIRDKRELISSCETIGVNE